MIKIYRQDGSPIDKTANTNRIKELNKTWDDFVQEHGMPTSPTDTRLDNIREKLETIDKRYSEQYPTSIEYPLEINIINQMKQILIDGGSTSVCFCLEDGELVAYLMD